MKMGYVHRMRRPDFRITVTQQLAALFVLAFGSLWTLALTAQTTTPTWNQLVREHLAACHPLLVNDVIEGSRAKGLRAQADRLERCEQSETALRERVDREQR